MKRTIIKLNLDIDYFRERIWKNCEDKEAKKQLARALEELKSFDAPGQKLLFDDKNT